MENLKSQGTKAFLWDFSGKIATQGMGFIISIFLARLLEPSDFGLIAIVMVIVGIASVFTDVGLGGALIQRRRLLSVHYSSVFYFNIFSGLMLTVITYFSAGWIGAFYNNDKLILLTQVMSLSFVINAFSSVHTTKLRKELNYAVLTKASFISSLASGGIGVYLAFHGAGVWSLVTQMLSMGVVYNIIIWTATKWRPSLGFSWKALNKLWDFGFRMFLSAIIASTFERLDFLIIGKVFSPVTLGYFQRAKSLNNLVIQYSSGSLMTILFPILSTVQTDLPRFQNIVIKMTGIINFIVFLLLGCLYLISEELIVLLFSEKWLPSVEIFKILILSGFGYPISALLVNILGGRGNSKAFFRLEIYKTILLGINLIVLYLWGIQIYLYGVLVTSLFAVLLNIFFAAHEINLPAFAFVKPFFIQMIISIIATICVLLLMKTVIVNGILLLILKISLFSIFYFFINGLFKTDSYFYFKKESFILLKNRGY